MIMINYTTSPNPKKSLILGSRYYFSQISLLKISHTALSVSDKNMHKKFTPMVNFSSFPYLVNIFAEVTEYIHYQMKDILLLSYYHEHVMYQKWLCDIHT